MGMMWDGSHIDPMKHVGLVWDSFGIDMGMMWEGSHTDPRIPVGLVWDSCGIDMGKSPGACGIDGG
jgi:hypothetical protein